MNNTPTSESRTLMDTIRYTTRAPYTEEATREGVIVERPRRRFKKRWVAIPLSLCLLGGGVYGAYNAGVTPDGVIGSVVPTETQYRVSGNSMSPTFTDGQILRFPKASNTPVKRGDIAVVDMPPTWEALSRADGVAVKRVVATAGDSISVTAGALTVNGVQVTDVNPACRVGAYEYTLQDGEMFLLGDNHAESLDSLSVLCSSEEPATSTFIVPTSAVKAHSPSPKVVTQ